MSQTPATRDKPSFTIPSILSIVAAIFSFRFGFTLGLVLAILAIALGVVGMLLAISPQRRGGIVSIVSIVMGLIGVIAAIVKLLGGNL